MSKHGKDPKKPRLPRIPVPPPGRFMEDDKYDREIEKREAERQIDEAGGERDEGKKPKGPDAGEPTDE